MIRNDDPRLVDGVLANYDATVVGPGPGRPEDAGADVCDIARSRGDEASAARRVSRARRAIGDGLRRRRDPRAAPDARQDLGDHARRPRRVRRLPSPFTATRYHSLCISHENFPAELRAIAASEDGVIQGVAHRTLPISGVQFHPESILTPAGAQLARNFLASARAMNDFPQLLRAVLAGEDLSADDAARAIGGIMDETISPVRTAALLAALAAKGETAEEIVGAARAMRERSDPRRARSAARDRHRRHRRRRRAHDQHLDRGRASSSPAAASRSPSTATARLRASAAAPTCSKRSASQIERDPEVSARLLRESRIAFLFARRHHPAMRAVGPVRTRTRRAHDLQRARTADESRRREPAGRRRGRRTASRAARGSAARTRRRCGGGRAFGERPRRDRRRGPDVRRAVRRRAANARAGRSIRTTTACTRRSTRFAAATPPSTPACSIRDPRAASGRRAPTWSCLNAALALVVAGVAEDINDGMEHARAAIAGGAARGALDALRARSAQGDRHVTDMLDKLYAATDAVRAADEAREPLDVLRARARARDRRTASVSRGAGRGRRSGDHRRDQARVAVGRPDRARTRSGRDRDAVRSGRRQRDQRAHRGRSLPRRHRVSRRRARRREAADPAQRLHAQRATTSRGRRRTAPTACSRSSPGSTDAELAEMFDEAAKYAIDVLVEVHDEAELDARDRRSARRCSASTTAICARSRRTSP